MTSDKNQNIGMISARIISGQLPRWDKCKVVAGNGNGKPCACCERPIISAEIQYDVPASEKDAHCRCTYDATKSAR